MRPAMLAPHRTPRGAADDGRLRSLVDIAAAAEHPAPLTLYATAAVKGLAGPTGPPELEQAFVIAAMLSGCLAKQALAARPPAPDRASPDWLAGFQHRLTRLVGFRTPGWAARPHGDRSASPTSPSGAGSAWRPLPEELAGRPQPPAAPVSLGAAGQATLWVAALRLAGLPATDVFQIRPDDGPDRVAVWMGGRLWCGGPGEPFAPVGLRQAAQWRIRRIFNDSVSICCSRSSLAEGFERARARASRGDSLVVPGEVPGQLVGPEAEADLIHRIREMVFLRSIRNPCSVEKSGMAPGPCGTAGNPACPWTLALYAHQTLLVHRPEAYALASAMTAQATRLARRFQHLDDLLRWMGDHLRKGSIFAEPDRVMLAHQVAAGRRGRALDRALLVLGAMLAGGASARLVQTTRSVYVVVRDRRGTRLVDAERLAAVDGPEGTLVLAFDAVGQYGLRDAWGPPEPMAAPTGEHTATVA